MSLKRKKRIFVCPLDWGLGHATRCIPVIKELQRQNMEIIIGAHGDTMSLLQKEFPKTAFLVFPGYNITYSRRMPMFLQMIRFIPQILVRIYKEHQYIDEIVDLHKIDGVISDNRYGLYSSKVPGILITHQLFIRGFLPVRPILRIMVKKFVSRFNRCWVPDFEDSDNNLSGKLSHRKNIPENVSYIGPLTRFTEIRSTVKRYDIIAIISGPEPQRTVLEDLLIPQLSDSGLDCLVVLGKPEETINKRKGNIEIRSHLTAKEMQMAIQQSDVVISRPGYSTIMDLAALGKKAIFVPTPGQTEQEYLARYHKKAGNCFWMRQRRFSLKHALEQNKNYRGLSNIDSEKRLENVVRDFIGSL